VETNCTNCGNLVCSAGRRADVYQAAAARQRICQVSQTGGSHVNPHRWFAIPLRHQWFLGTSRQRQQRKSGRRKILSKISKPNLGQGLRYSVLAQSAHYPCEESAKSSLNDAGFGKEDSASGQR
jgi:hypothetical protein